MERVMPECCGCGKVVDVAGMQAKQRKVLAALGLTKLHMEKTFQDNAAVRGMIAQIPHMLEVSE